MRVLIIADRSIARRERAMLSRLEVGLADEGVRVIHAVPRSAAESENVAGASAAGLYSTAVWYDDAGLALTRRARVKRLLATIDQSEPEGETAEIDIIHAFGAGCWPFAIELARLTSAAVVLELWRSSEVGAAVALSRETKTQLRFIVSETAVAKALRERAPAAQVHSAPWGVHAPSLPRAPYTPTRPLAAAVLADAQDSAGVRATTAALAGLLEATRDGAPNAPPGSLIFLGAAEGAAGGSRESAVWHAARKLEILDRLSMVPDMEARREPVLQMDWLILPEAGGRERTLALEAMGTGMLVIAAADPFVESLEDGVTARLVRTATPQAWSEAFRSLLTAPDTAANLTRSAHAWVREHRTASDQVAAVLKVYDQIMQSASHQTG